jgi:hypothetical protein
MKKNSFLTLVTSYFHHNNENYVQVLLCFCVIDGPNSSFTHFIVDASRVEKNFLYITIQIIDFSSHFNFSRV